MADDEARPGEASTDTVNMTAAELEEWFATREQRVRRVTPAAGGS
jgi:hypothetical protein